MVTRARTLGGSGALALLCVAALAHAEPKPKPATSSLGWLRLRGAEECVSSQELARDVEARLGRAVFVSAARADVSVEGHVERSGKGFRATLVARDSDGKLLGSRELSEPGSSCAPLREQVAFVIAVMIDPDAALAPAEQAPVEEPPKPEPGSAPVAPEPPKAAPEPPKAAPAPLHFDSGASLVGAAGLMPSAALGVQVDGILHPPGLIPLEGRGGVFPDRSARTGDGERVFAFGYLTGGVCPLWLHGRRLSAYACVASTLGLMHVQGSQAGAKLETANDGFFAPTLDGRLALRLAGPLALRVGIAGMVPLLRPGYRLTDAAGTRVEVHRLSPVVGMLDVGLGLVIP